MAHAQTNWSKMPALHLGHTWTCANQLADAAYVGTNRALTRRSHSVNVACEPSVNGVGTCVRLATLMGTIPPHALVVSAEANAQQLFMDVSNILAPT